MAQLCSVCASDARREIDVLLLSGKPTRSVARQHGFTQSTIARHRKHLAPAIAKARAEVEATYRNDLLEFAEAEGEEARTILQRLRALSAETHAILTEARATNNPNIALQAIARAERQLELEGRLLGELANGATVNVGVGVVNGTELQQAVDRGNALLPFLTTDELSTFIETFERAQQRQAGRLPWPDNGRAVGPMGIPESATDPSASTDALAKTRRH